MGRVESFKPRGRNRQSRKRNSIIVIGCEGKNKTDVAIKNAKEVEKYHLKAGKSIDDENSNPYTGVYKVVEELIRRNK